MKRPLLCLLGVIVGLAGCSGDTETDAGIATVSADQARDASACGVDEPLLHVPSPDWRDQILYMMFIDRFNDGDPSNNELGAGEFNARSPAHFNGGDLQGIRDKLDYLQGLGATGVWITPPVLNQWWSTPYAAAGWHGYWAVNFKEMDPHFGTLDDYKALSSDLHCNGMVLIQDIVGNHVGNFYAYEGEWDPNDTAKNFVLLEEGSLQPAPTQYPFNMIDRRNPEHAAADIYHWTPPLNDYNDQNQLYNYAFGFLGDINTENPVVIDALKDSYRFWVEEVGVDGYRIDTVMYVPLKFWHHLLHDPDGVNATARKTGRDHFLNFGEVLVPSEPFKDDGEQRILKYYGTPEMPGLNSMLGFPLYFTIGRVMAQGQPAAQLAFRLEQRMKSYPDPYVIPTFVDNHDTARFLSSGGEAAFRQALTLIFTIPGMPIIYQGTEQGLLETRQAMFESGWMGEPAIFDTQSEYYQLIKGLAAMRTGSRVFTRGTMQVLAGEENGPGVLAYRRDHEGEAALVLINTASHGIVVSGLNTGGTSEGWVPWENHPDDCCSLISDEDGTVNLEMDSRQVMVLRRFNSELSRAVDLQIPGGGPRADVVIDMPESEGPFEYSFDLSGSVPPSASQTDLRLVRNGNLDSASTIQVRSDGSWTASVPVRNLGESEEYLQVYQPESISVSEKIPFRTRVTVAEVSGTAEDPDEDAFGPTGSYIRPQQSESGDQREIMGARWRAAGANLELTLTMKVITDVWQPPNGFDNLAISTFIDIPGRQGASDLPLLNAAMPAGNDWDVAHVGSGWISYTYSSDRSSAKRQGSKFGVAPRVTASKDQREITLFFQGERLGINSWDDATLYVTTWDVNGEGTYLNTDPEPSNWHFGGAPADAPKVMDDLLVTISTDD